MLMGPHDQVSIRVQVDGKETASMVDSRTSLADFLRDDLAITGVRIGCEQGVCGSCTVMLDGTSQRSCLVLAVQSDGSTVETVAGLNDADGSDVVDLLRQALAKHFALQCGFCASGLVVTATEYLATNPEPDEADVRRMLSGNICRCTGYDGMVKAILEVAASEATRI